MGEQLYIYEGEEGTTLADVASAFLDVIENPERSSASASPGALLYGVERCHLARLVREGDGISFRAGQESGSAVGEVSVPLDQVFEARIFSEIAELRWLDPKDRPTRWAVLSERGDLPLFGGVKVNLPFIDILEQRYLLWGRCTKGSRNGWAEFTSAETGAFFVPLGNLAEGDYAQFRVREYLREYADGNVAVAEERLVGLCKQKAPEAGGASASSAEETPSTQGKPEGG